MATFKPIPFNMKASFGLKCINRVACWIVPITKKALTTSHKSKSVK